MCRWLTFPRIKLTLTKNKDWKWEKVEFVLVYLCVFIAFSQCTLSWFTFIKCYLNSNTLGEQSFYYKQLSDPRRSRRFRVHHVSWGLSACGFSSWLCVLSAHRDMNPETWMSTYEKFYKAIFSFQGNSGRKVMPKLEGVWSHMGCDPASPPSLLCSPVCFISLTDWYLRRWDREKQRQRQRWRETERKRERRREGERWQCAVREIDNKGSMSWFYPLTLFKPGLSLPSTTAGVPFSYILLCLGHGHPTQQEIQGQEKSSS